MEIVLLGKWIFKWFQNIPIEKILKSKLNYIDDLAIIGPPNIFYRHLYVCLKYALNSDRIDVIAKKPVKFQMFYREN